MDLSDLGLRRWSRHETACKDLVVLVWDGYHGIMVSSEIWKSFEMEVAITHPHGLPSSSCPGTCSMAGPGWISPASGLLTHHRHQWAFPHDVRKKRICRE